MHKSELVEKLRRDLEGNDALLLACEAILTFLERQRPEALRHISFGTLSKAAGLTSAVDAVPVAEYLSSRRVRLLEKCFFFTVGDDEFEVSAEEMREASQARVMYHPSTGEAVSDFEKFLHLYFVPGEEARDIIGRST
jgi:hypothetical protein